MDAAAPTPRDPNLRLAGLHLRLGSIALARAELETLAGADALDGAGRIDLVEARWRSGDLTGAGEVARAVLAGGDEPIIALVVAAEAAASLGRPSEARRLASRALELADGSIDPIFAGMARAAVWPADPTEPVPSPATLFPTERIVHEGPAVADTPADDPADRHLGQDEGPGFWDHEEVPAGLAAVVAADAVAGEPAPPVTDEVPAAGLAALAGIDALAQTDQEADPEPATATMLDAESATAAELAAGQAFEASPESGHVPESDSVPEPEAAPEPEPAAEQQPAPEPEPVHMAVSDDVAARLETGRAAIAAGDAATAALYLGLVVRLAPALAGSVIETIGGHDDPALLMVRGDALRALGRDAEAQDAYARAMSGR
jgi:hypothetical protein